MRVLSNDMEATVTGTVLAIDVLPTGTCLCCLHGTVRCDARDGAGAKPVEDGRRGFAWRTGKPPEWGPAVEPHLVPMRELEGAIQKHGWGK